MAAENQQGSLSAAFPAPPPFYKSFTTENIERVGQHFQDSQLSTDSTGSSVPLDHSKLASTNVPSSLQNLVPPPPPADGKYRSFGVDYDVKSKTGSNQSTPTREALLELNDRLLRLYLRYVQILATDPSGHLWVPQWQEIRKTFEEMHRIINEYRPHQARETLILMMEDQIKQFREETQTLKSSVARTEEVLESLAGGSREHVSSGGNVDGNTAGYAEGTDGSGTKAGLVNKDFWRALEQEVGTP